MTERDTSRRRTVLVECATFACVLLAALVAACALVGWYTADVRWVRLLPSAAPMQPNTAVTMLLACASALCLALRWRIACGVLGVLYASIGSLTLLEYLLGLDLGIDRLLLRVEVIVGDPFPGRMAPSTAVTFASLGIGTALYALVGRARPWHWPALFFALASGVILIGLGGYVLGLRPTYAWGLTTRMGLNTTSCFCLIALAMLSLAIGREARGWRDRTSGLALGLCLAMSTITAECWNLADMLEARNLVQRVEAEAARIARSLDADHRIRERALGRLARVASAQADSETAAEWRGQALALSGERGYALVAFVPHRGPSELAVGSIRSGSTQTLFTELEMLPRRFRGRPGLHDATDHLGRLVWVYETSAVASDGSVLPTPGAVVAVDTGYSFAVSLLSALQDDLRIRIFREGHVLVRSDLGAADSALAVTHALASLGDDWRLSLAPTRSYVRSAYPFVPILVLGFGLLVSLLCGATLHLTLRTGELARLRDSDLKRLELVLNQLSEGVVFANQVGELEFFNDQAREVLGLGITDAPVDRWPDVYSLYALDGSELISHEELPLVRALKGESLDDVEVAFKKSGSSQLGVLSASARPVFDNSGAQRGGVVVFRDVSKIKQAERETAEMEVQLRQAQKMEAIGQLAAGIAHEMNTPSQYVSDNLCFIRESFEDILAILAQLDQLHSLPQQEPVPWDKLESLLSAVDKADLDFLLEEIPSAIEQSNDGISRVTKIVRAMRDFAHPGSPDKQLVDLEKAISSTVTVSRNEWKYVARVETDFADDLDEVVAIPGELNQVLLNLIVNAAHAIGDVVREGEEKGTITICTRRTPRWALITVSDTGSGIPEEIRSRIFDPFFTTKEVGKGTGQGLAIVRSIIVDKHGGEIDLRSEPGGGTTFELRLPLSDDVGAQST